MKAKKIEKFELKSLFEAIKTYYPLLMLEIWSYSATPPSS